jgi:hypothetical protein
VLQRFDARRLKPVLPGEVTARLCRGTQAIVEACRLGAGPATRPRWQPWLPARIEWPFGAFHVRDAELARRACLQLDGSWAMDDAAGAIARWGVRLQAQRADLAWWRPLAPGDAWDAGFAPSAAALKGFVPRRATLIVLEPAALDDEGLRAVAGLEQQAWNWPRAVRVLVAGGPVPGFARPLGV